MARRTRADQQLNPARPVNWEYPLSDGLICFPMIRQAPPGWGGGVTVYDGVRGAKPPNDGLLAGTTKWGIFEGSRVLSFPGYDPSGPVVLGSGLTQVLNGAQWTIRVRFMATDVTNPIRLFGNVDDPYARTIVAGYTANKLTLMESQYSNIADSVSTISNGMWYDVVWRHNAGANDLFINGIPDSSPAWTFHGSATGNYRLGFSYFQAYIDAVSVFSGLVDADALHTESLHGYPNLLNWLPRGGYGVAGAAPPAGAFNPYYYRHLAGGCSNF